MVIPFCDNYFLYFFQSIKRNNKNAVEQITTFLNAWKPQKPQVEEGQTT
jgi:hypothetical protein